MSQSRKNSKLRLTLETLEDRNLLSISSLWFSGSTLVARADNFATSAGVYQSGSNFVIDDWSTGKTWSYPASWIGRVEFQGGAGNDSFVNYVANLPVSLYGFGGNDYLEGYNANDYFDGGDGNDTLVGYGGNDLMFGGSGNDILRGMYGNDQLVGQDGNDQLDGGDGNDSLWGGNGNDVLLGQAGNDALIGDYGNDQLNGGAGTDSLWGGYGDDTLVAIDNGTGDYVEGDAGRDTFWVDANLNWSWWWTTTTTDRVVDAAAGDKVQNVYAFTNGADRTLDGDRIADPTLKTGVYSAVSNKPLFGTYGPQASDIHQGNLGDCWLLAGLGAIANDDSMAIRQNVVDFNDGTYGVHLGNNFYRVDNDLPVGTLYSTNLVDARFGAENSMWVAVVEKAYAYYRTGANSYASLEGGWSVDVNRAFGATATGNVAISSFANATALANAIYSHWNNYEAVTIGFVGNSSTTVINGVPLIDDHMYTVMWVNRDWYGNVTSIVLRNPWGYDGAGSDSNTSDGLVTVTAAQLFGLVGRLNWGRV